MTITTEDSVPSIIWEHTDQHITQTTKDAYTKHIQDGRIVMVARNDRGDILGCAAVCVSYCGQPGWWNHAFVIVHRAHRNEGIGTALLRARIAEQHKMLPFTPHLAYVANDNKASLAMCAKANLTVGAYRSRKRSNGDIFTQALLSEVIA